MFMDWILHNAPVLILALPLLAAFATPLVGKLGKWPRNVFVVSVAVIVEALVIYLASDVIANGMHTYVFGAASGILLPSGYSVPVRIIFQVDAMSVFMAIISATVTLAGIVYSWAFVTDKQGQSKYYTLLLMMAVGMFGMEFTGDLFNMFVFLEILSIASCALVAFRISFSESSEGALKYMVVSAVGALFVLIAIALLYGQYNVLNLAAVGSAIQFTALDKIALVLLVSAFAMKCGAVPMHMWTPDAYSAAPAPITMVLVSASQASMYALFRIAFTLYGVSMNTGAVGWFIIILGVLSMFIGVTMALPQKDIKRLMAYHAISQSGYMLLGVGVGLATLGSSAFNEYGLTAMKGGIFHIINHAMYKGLLFLTAGAIYYRLNTRNLNKMGGLGHTMKWTAAFFIIGALAIAGIPPFNGFASKVLIYESVFRFSPLLSIIAMLVSVLTLASFVKVFHSAFMGPRLPEYEGVAKEVPWPMFVAMALLAAIVVAMGLFPNLIVDNLVTPAAQALAGRADYLNAVMGGA
ncbi:MAG: NADH:ubiquinone oxidoreductase [Thermoplasmata archaeon HGW-Thermoplasmata-1]|nr:MAG: NADH:ubiquinone oxidoreductase [Thermoplasmata archaeon HGW-Thermoplasmata-1]